MRGTVLSVDFSPAQLDPATGAASTYLIIVRATVEFTDVANDVVLFESDEFTLRDEFSIGDDPDAAFDREGLAFSRIASAFADSLLVAILEGFLVWCPGNPAVFERRCIPSGPLRSAFRISRNALGIPPDSRLASRAPRRSR